LSSQPRSELTLGVAFAPTPDCWVHVKRAEELGFSHAWFYDSPMLYTDVFVAMALAAHATTSIKLATGVLVPGNRIAPAAAGALASLNRLAPGRIVCGLGSGMSGRRTLGRGAMRVDDLRDYLATLRGLLSGQTVEYAEPGARLTKTRFYDPDAGFVDIDADVPLILSAFGPRTLAMTAEQADGWIGMGGGPVELALMQADALRTACDTAGRDMSELEVVSLGMGCVLAPGEPPDSERAVAQAGPLAAVAFHGWVEGSLGTPPEPLVPAVEAYRKLYESFGPPAERHLELHRRHMYGVMDRDRPFVSGELVACSTFTASEDELRGRLRRMHDAGYTQVVIQLVPGHEDAIEDWARVARSL